MNTGSLDYLICVTNFYDRIVLHVIQMLSDHSESHVGIYSPHVNKLEIRTYDLAVIS